MNNFIGTFSVGVVMGLCLMFGLIFLANKSHNENLCKMNYKITEKYIKCTHHTLYENIYLIRK